MGPARSVADRPEVPMALDGAPKSLLFHWFYSYFTIWCSRIIVISLVLQLFHYVVTPNHCFPIVLMLSSHLAQQRGPRDPKSTPRCLKGIPKAPPQSPKGLFRDPEGPPQDPHKRSQIVACHRDLRFFEDKRLSSLNMLKM